MVQAAAPFPIFTDTNGLPLDYGYLYFGTIYLNPETSPIAAYWDRELTQPAAQPIRTVNGYPMRDGSPTRVYFAEEYSVTVKNSAGNLVIYAPVNYGVERPASSDLAAYTRAEALVAIIPATVALLTVYHGGLTCQYERDASGTALTTGDGATWSPAAGNATPAHWGGVPGYGNDATTYVQSCFTWVGAGYDANLGTFDRWVNLAGAVWECTASINSTNVRQPQMRFGNGVLFFNMTSGYGLEMWGVNSGVIVEPFYIETPADPDNCPEAAFCFGRCSNGVTAAPIAPSMKGAVFIDGNCSKSSIINLGCEVSGVVPYIHNGHPSTTAYCYYGSGHMQDAVDIWGAELSSSFCTLPPASAGAFSNILHDLRSGEFKRDSDWQVTITGITRASPAVVSFTTTAAFSARMADGQTTYLSNVGGMIEVKNRTFTIAGLSIAVDGLSGSFQLSGEDSTLYTPWASTGLAWRATYDALFFGSGSSACVGPAGYLLTYGGSGVHLHCRNGGLSDFNFAGQVENSPPNPVNIDVGAASAVIQGLNLDFLAIAQTIVAPLKLTRTSGTLSIRNLNLTVNTAAAAFADELCTNGANLSVRNAMIRVPNALDVSGLANFAGMVWIQNPEDARWYANKTNYISLSNGAIKINGEAIGTTGSYSTTQFSDITHAVNTTNKVAGLTRYDTTSAKLIYAAGANASAVWRYCADDTTAYTPV
jgi:hypothetical protein